MWIVLMLFMPWVRELGEVEEGGEVEEEGGGGRPFWVCSEKESWWPFPA